MFSTFSPVFCCFLLEGQTSKKSGNAIIHSDFSGNAVTKTISLPEWCPSMCATGLAPSTMVIHNKISRLRPWRYHLIIKIALSLSGSNFIKICQCGIETIFKVRE